MTGVTLIASAMLGILLCLHAIQAPASDFVTFESGQVRPLVLSQDQTRLFAVNTPDNRLEIFDIKQDGLTHTYSVPVGLEPVAVAARTNSEIWVVNHLSDSISVVDVSSSPPRVVRTLLVGDEPRDIVFAGPDSRRAFITTAHRGQNSPYIDSANPGELTTPGIGRADVWVFDAVNLGSSLGGTPIQIVNLFGDSPRALAVSPDGSTVYTAVFHSGNQTTALTEGAVCDTPAPCIPSPGELTSPGGLPPPNANTVGDIQPQVGLIVKYDGANWLDELGRVWDNMVRFNLPDLDVFAIDANATPLVVRREFAHVGTILFNMAVNPVNGKVYVSNTEAKNEVRFEGARPPGSIITTVQGKLHQTHISIINPADGVVLSRHLNKHIDYSLSPAPAGTKEHSLALPRQMAMSSNGETLYLAALGSNKIGVYDTAALEANTFNPESIAHIPLSGGGPTGVVLDEARSRLYVLTRFDNAVSIIDTASHNELRHYALHNPEPPHVVNGRRFLYDANLTSSNGEAACASCHIDGDLDSLAWDLGDPLDVILNNPGPFILGPIASPPQVYADFHPMKGPMTTQTLRGMANHGPMHWRGDRTGGNDEPTAQPDSGTFNEVLAFKKFNVAFESLLGREGPLTDAQMQAFAEFMLEVTPQPNPIRALDNSLTPLQQAGSNTYFNIETDTFTCNGCHVLDPALGFFGTDGQSSFEGESQHFKIPHLRNLYTKVGMFGLPAISFIIPGDNSHKGDQIRGFGFLHDGSIDTVFRFLSATLFSFPGGDIDDDIDRRNVEQFMLAMDSNLKPVIGQQITLNSSNAAGVGPRIDLFIAQASIGNCDLIVKGRIDGMERGWWRQTDGRFLPDKAVEAALTDSQLRALSNTAGQELTYTCVPPLSGQRVGIDRDEDGVLDGDDVCPTVADSAQTDDDGDRVGNVCDICIAVHNPDQRDTNGDGYGNLCDGDLNNDGGTNTLDLQLYASVYRSRLGDPNYDPDADYNGDDRINTLDLNIFSTLYRKPPGPSCCGL